MNKIKNQHLLLAVVALSILSTTVCLALVSSEKANTSRLDQLALELKKCRESQHESESNIVSRMDRFQVDLKATQKNLADNCKTLNGSIGQLEKMLSTDINEIQKEIEEKRNILTNLQKKVYSLEQGLQKLTEVVKKLEQKNLK